jgi:hypothetical protein
MPDQKAVKLSTYGIIYFGTPHQGANNVTLAMLFADIAKVHLRTNNTLLKRLKLNGIWLENEQHNYNNISKNFDTVFAYESLPTPMIGGGTIEVRNPSISQPINTYM